MMMDADRPQLYRNPKIGTGKRLEGSNAKKVKIRMKCKDI